MIAVKLEHLRTPLDHLLKGVLAGTTLAMLIVSPRVNLTVFHQSQRVCRAACDLMHNQCLLSNWRFLRDKALDKYWGTLLLSVRVLDTELALGVGAHCIDQLLSRNEYRMRSTACNLDDRNVVRTEPGNRMNLSLSIDLLPKAKLPKSVTSP